MDDRCSSPEIDVVGLGDQSRSFTHRREMSTYSGRNARNIRQANQSDAIKHAANTKAKGKSNVETVNLRVKNMGIIIVKKEPEEDDDSEVSYSLSSLLDECDFEQVPRKKVRALKSPTSLALAQSKSSEAVRPISGRPRQSLEHVISSLKSARDTSIIKPKSSTNRAPNFQSPVVPISMPSHILSVAPAPHNSFSLPGGARGATVPQIIDVRSLATGPHTVSTGTAAKTSLNLSSSKPYVPQSVQLSSRALSSAYSSQGASNIPVTLAQLARPVSAGPATQSMPNLPKTKPLIQGSQVPSMKPATTGSKPLNIRFVLPATAPFNTTEFQQVLQAALASVVSQSKGVEASLLQQAIQGALLTVAKSPQPYSVIELKRAIQDSLAVLVANSPSSTGALRQQFIVPKLPNTRTVTDSIKQLKTSPGMAASGINPTCSPLTVIYKNISPVTQTGSLLTSGVETSSCGTQIQKSLSSARDALVKVLQEKRFLNSPQSLSSATSTPTSDISPLVPEPVSIDEPCLESSPTSPEVPMLQEPTVPASSKPWNTVSSVKHATSTPASTLSPTISASDTNPTVQATISQPQVITSSENALSTKEAPTSTPSEDTTQPKKAGKSGCGGGCCQFCRTCHENVNTCGFPSCQKIFPSKQALRKHYYFNPSHALRIPVEKASVACENFLPLELNELHRKARIRELLKRIDDDELKELLMPRLAKIVSLFQLLEQKSLRVSLGSISAFKMFSEFERFKKEVEARLLDLIFQPQGKSCGRTGKNKLGLNIDKTAKGKTAETSSAIGSQIAASAFGQDASKDMSLSATSTPLDSFTDSNSGGVTSETAKKTVELDVDSSTVKTTTEALKALLQSESKEVSSSLGDKGDANKEEIPNAVRSGNKSANKTSSVLNVPESSTAEEAANNGSSPELEEVVRSGADSTDMNTREVPNAVASGAPEDKSISPVNINTEHSGKDSGNVEKSSQPGMTTKQEDFIPSGEDGSKEDEPNSNPQSVEANQGSGEHQKPESLQPPDNVGGHSDKPTLKNSPSFPLDCLPQYVTGEGRISSEIESTDVLMADNQEEANCTTQDGVTNSSKEEKKNESQRDTIENIGVVRGEGGKVHVSTGGVNQKTEESNREQTKSALDVMKGMEVEVQDSNFTDNSTIQGDKMTAEHSDQAKEIVCRDTGRLGNTSKAECQEDQIMICKEDETGVANNENTCTPKPKSDQEDISESGSASVKPNVDSEDIRQQQTLQGKATESYREGDKEKVNSSSKKETTDEGGSNSVVDQVYKDATETSDEIPHEKGDKQVVEVTSEKNADTNPSTEEKSQGTSAGDTNAAESSSLETEVGSDKKDDAVAKEKTLKETLENLISEDLEELDENNIMDFDLPLAVKWGRVIKKVKDNEVKKIARKENYSDQDMKHFIFHKPKEAASAVIIADCHAHPSFFRAYVMPALLDKHIDDFGVFGKKLLSRLYLSQQKYVKVLRNNIGPQLAKILGINIFPTYKRIQDTWATVKRPGWTTGPSALTVFTIEPEDDYEVPDDVEGIESQAQTLGPSVQELHGVVQSHANRIGESLKRATSANTTLPDGNKKQRLENSDATIDVQSEKGNKTQTPASSEITVQKETTRQLNEWKTTPVEIDSSKSNDQGDNMQQNRANKNQTKALDDLAAAKHDTENAVSTRSVTASRKGTSASQESDDKTNKADTGGAEPVRVNQDRKQDNESADPQATGSSVAFEKPSCSSSSAWSTPTASSSTDQPTSSTSTIASSIIPPKATIYTNPTGKKGDPSMLFPVSKGSPLFLVPIEKISPKLIEKFIQEANKEGVKTRSSDKKRGKQPRQTNKQKQGSQVLLLVPSSIPNTSPTIQTLTSSEQLEGTGDKKPLLLLPADKVPKTIANQSQTVRRKMVITMIAQTSSAQSSAISAPTVTATSTTGGQSSSPTSAIRSVKGPIMSTQEGKSNTTSTDGNRDSSVLSSASTDAGKSVEDLTSVVNNTSALNSPVKERLSTSVSGSNQSTSQAKLLCKSRSAASATPLTETNVDENRPLACSSDFDLSESSVLPSDTVPDEILKDMSGDGTGSDANVMPSLDLSGIISSFGEMPAQTGSNTAVSASHRDTASAVGRSADSQIPSIIRGKPYLQDDDLSYTTTRRQSRRRTPAPPKPASRSSSRDPSDTDGEGETSGSSSHDYSLRKTSSPFSSGASKDDSDADEGSPVRKRRRVPTRTNPKSSLQVTFVSDRGIPAKVSHTSPARTKGKKH